MAEILYQVRLKDLSGGTVAVFVGAGRSDFRGGLWGFEYYKRLRTPGGFTLRVDGDDERVGLFQLDYLVEFWRRDRIAPLDWYLDFAAFHRSWEINLSQDGRQTFISRGRGLNDLLGAEAIRYARGSAGASKSGPAETVAKEYVDENVGPGAGARAMAGLTVEADTGSGATWEGDRANKNLLDVTAELAEYGPGDYMVEPAGAAAFEFRWRSPRWGTDRTEGNAAGNPPAVFDPLLGNATNMTWRHSRLSEVNVVYVAGTGLGAYREYVTRTSGDEGDSPWARRAVARTVQAGDLAALQAYGDGVLEQQRPRAAFSFDVLQTVATRYGRDWDVGDLVTARLGSRRGNVKVVGVRVSMRSDGVETIVPEIEEE